MSSVIISTGESAGYKVAYRKVRPWVFFNASQLAPYNLEYQDTPQALFERYDFITPIEPQNRYLTPLSWLLSFPDTLKYKNTLHKDLKDIKPPYLLLCNHSSFLDFKVMTKALFPHRANYVVALDGFVGRKNYARSGVHR